MTISATSLAELLDRHWGPLVAWVGPCNGAAEDVVQQAFIALSRETTVPAQPIAWLYKTSRNLACNERKQRTRRIRRHQVVARPEQQPCPLWQTQEAAELAERLGELPSDAREIVVARIWGELSFDEIAKLVHKSRATVWRHYNAALESLRDIYGVPCNTKTTAPRQADPNSTQSPTR